MSQSPPPSITQGGDVNYVGLPRVRIYHIIPYHTIPHVFLKAVYIKNIFLNSNYFNKEKLKQSKSLPRLAHYLAKLKIFDEFKINKDIYCFSARELK